jgi:hypothetical protein
MRIVQKIKNEYEKLLISKGEEYFYKYAIGCGFMDRSKNDQSEILMLDKADAFFVLFRQTGNNNYFIIGKVLRRAAHRLYRDRLRSNIDAVNVRFLNIVK